MADATGFDIGKLFADPNFQSMLAGMGARLDPQGVGGAIGGATQQYVQTQAAQKALTGQESQRRGTNMLLGSIMLPDNDPRKEQMHNEAIKLLGGMGMTPQDKEGITSISAGPNNTYTVKLTAPSKPFGQEGPVSQEPVITPSTPMVSPPATTTTPTVVPRRTSQLNDYLPFYSAPGALHRVV